MNTGILHSARPKKGQSTAKLPKAAVKFAKQMGLDLKGLEAEAEDIWTMLDDLSTKPEEYTEFIQQQMENAKLTEESKTGDSPKYFRPQAGFSIRTWTTGGDGIKVRDTSNEEKSGKKLFVNLCSHEAIEIPMDSFGNQSLDDRYSADGLQLPLLIGPLRETQDSLGAASLAVDAVFHPSVIHRCKLHVTFKKQVIALTLHWVQQETKVSFDLNNWTGLKAPYMCGRGSSKDTPVLFPVDEALRQSERQEDSDIGSNISSTNQVASTTGKGGGGPSKALTSPLSLLKLVKEQNDPDFDDNSDLASLMSKSRTGMASNNPPNKKQSANKTITEKTDNSSSSTSHSQILMTDNNNTEPQITERISKNKLTTTTTTTKPLIKKGFLNSKKPANLYPENSPDEIGTGKGTGGTYARFMEKCKIVDMSKMSPEEVSAATKQYALGIPDNNNDNNGSSSSIGTNNKKESTTKLSSDKKSVSSTTTTSASNQSKDGFKKGFISDAQMKNKSLFDDNNFSDSNHSVYLNKEECREIDQIMSSLDEEYQLQKPSQESEDPWTAQLQELSKLIGGSNIDPLSQVGCTSTYPLKSTSSSTTTIPSSFVINHQLDVEGTSKRDLTNTSISEDFSTRSSNKSHEAFAPQIKVLSHENASVLLASPLISNKMDGGDNKDYEITSSGLQEGVTVSVEQQKSADVGSGTSPTLVLLVQGVSLSSMKVADLQISERQVLLKLPIGSPSKFNQNNQNTFQDFDDQSRNSSSTSNTISEGIISLKCPFLIDIKNTSAIMSKKKSQIKINIIKC